MLNPVTYTLEELVYRRMLWKHYGDYWLMRSRWFTGPIAIALGFVGMSGVVANRHFWFVGGILILTGLHMLFSRHLYINRVIKAWKKLPDNRAETQITIRDNKLNLVSEMAETSMTGATINKVRDFDEGFFIYLSRQHFIAIPRKAFADEHEYHAWIQAIRELAGPDSGKEGWT